MPIRILVVDDSAFFRRRIKEILEQRPELVIAGFADNGQDAVEQVKRLKPDVVTMDYEMPQLDGISAVQQIMAVQPTPILMFSSLSYSGARVTLDALEAGAADYLPKNFETMASGTNSGAKLLQDKVLAIARHRINLRKSAQQMTPTKIPGPTVVRPITPNTDWTSSTKPSLSIGRPNVLLIGASTGGPVVLQKLLTALPENFSLPILMVQHMPRTFTTAFAERLNRLCRIQVKEAEDGDSLRPGRALLAPGGMQMLVSERGTEISIVEGDERIQYNPSVDITFGSAARNIKGKVLAVVLTGMGQDGREGCRALKQKQATILTQDEKSCVVYGMPMAVEKSGLSDAVLTVEQLCHKISEF